MKRQFAASDLPRALLVFSVYVDESGTEGQSWCVCAGLRGRTEDWRPFEAAWFGVLTGAGVDYFHSKELFPATGAFRGWDWPRRWGLVNRLTEVIVDHPSLELIASAVEVAAFRALGETDRTYLTGGRWDGSKWAFTGAPSRPYYLPLCNVLDRSFRTAEPTHLFHDQNPVYAGYITRLLQEMRARREPQAVRQAIGPIMFGSKTDIVPLQAADLAAYVTFHVLTEGRASFGPEMGVASNALGARLSEGRLVAYDAASMAAHLDASMPTVLRAGEMPGQKRAKRRRAAGQAKQFRKTMSRNESDA
jgi:hypothetical protein